MNKLERYQPRFWIALLPALLLTIGWGSLVQAQVATRAPVTGEIEQITINNLANIYSGGKIVVGGQIVILPANLLIDLPANRLTLKQIYDQAPAACLAAGESGLAKSDSCNTSGVGGFATISTNRTSNGNVIAGDVFIEKGREALTGAITFINHTDGYFRVNGNAGDDTTGVMVRLNDPGARHTIQQGVGCLPGAPNCSPDPRFTLDPDNYTNAFSTGFPLCIPSTVTGIGSRTVGSNANGGGDPFCPVGNRTVNGGQPVNDSRRFAPILLGDSILAEGNFETVNGTRFLSAHTTRVAAALATKPDLNQPDYLFMEEVFVDAMGFNNQRARALFIGFATFDTDMRIWSRHWDPVANEVHEFPLASVRGCDAIGGGCGANGLAAGAAGNIFKIRYDIDFVDATLITKKPELYPCPSLTADPEWGGVGGLDICPNGGLTIRENFGILSPTPHEIHVKSRKKTDSLKPGGTPLVTRDIQGNDSPNGEYIFPMGINLGGIETPEFVEINLGALQTPWLFSGLPWNLDRRLSPGGCQNVGGCEGAPQPLNPFPFEGLDPRTNEPTLPAGDYSDPNYTNTTLTNVRNRILSFVDGAIGNFNGNTTVLAWPPANPAAIPIVATPLAIPCAAGGGGGINQPVVAVADTAASVNGAPVTIDVIANDTGSVNPATLAVANAPSPAGSGVAVPQPNGSFLFTPGAAFTGDSIFRYTVQDSVGNVSNVARVTVTVGNTVPRLAPIANVSIDVGVPFSLLATATDSLGDPLTFSLATAPAGMTIDAATGLIRWTPGAAQVGANTVTVVVRDQGGLSATRSFTAAVRRDTVVVLVAEFTVSTSTWRLSGFSSLPGAIITVFNSPDLTGTPLGTATANGDGTWSLRGIIPIVPNATQTISVQSNAGGIADRGVVLLP